MSSSLERLPRYRTTPAVVFPQLRDVAFHCRLGRADRNSRVAFPLTEPAEGPCRWS
jgi:hypothetical protein